MADEKGPWWYGGGAEEEWATAVGRGTSVGTVE